MTTHTGTSDLPVSFHCILLDLFTTSHTSSNHERPKDFPNLSVAQQRLIVAHLPRD